jgi:DNA-directed RNA polymerase specialized sigma24 family protein
MDRHTPVVSQATQSLTAHPLHLRLATVDSAPDYAEFVESVLHDEEEERARATTAGDELSYLDKRLTTRGWVVAARPWDGPPTARPRERDLVMDIRVARLRRVLREMPAQQSKVVRLYWGIDEARPLSEAEVAARVGVPQTAVNRLLADGMAELCRRFGIPPDLAA